MNHLEKIGDATADAVMSRLMRGETRALRDIIAEEVRRLCEQIMLDAGWSEWPTKDLREAFCKLQL